MRKLKNKFRKERKLIPNRGDDTIKNRNGSKSSVEQYEEDEEGEDE